MLSELPISESSVGTPLKKSLLFHPRVAEEANHLLSMKDDALTRQLTEALEQTNADHMYVQKQMYFVKKKCGKLFCLTFF